MTSSIRIPADLSTRLERTAHRLNKGKNWIIVHALDEYLRKTDREALAAEARQQSLAANEAARSEDDEFWEAISDARGWK